MAAPPLVVLVESMVEEILLRFPPDDPASLVRAALVCKPWCRLVAGRGFRRRFREFHRTPPVLGLLCNSMDKGHFEEDVVRFVPAASFPPTQRVRLNYRAIDARHGRVLLRCMLWDCDDLLNGEFVVRDPITHKERVLPSLPRYPDRWSAAVLCAATASGTCDHLDCSGGPFLGDQQCIFTSWWSEQRVQHPSKPAHWLWPSVLVGNELCFLLPRRTRILKYNLLTREISMVVLPSLSYKPDLLTATEDGRSGFATVHKSRLYLWPREDASGDNEGWTERRVIKLQNLLPVKTPLRSAAAAGFAAGVGIVFVRTKVGVFSIDLKSQLVRKCVMVVGRTLFPT
ncbi:hypothetical protein PR202_ga28526 [Eleusine coracana subsp. coracana]|uniref:F-box domain-containing protein n=1 Tax=Eleusine coracana subsp. coracana TaxID=191504 RepID=A0AAV5DJF9_ELECO|nr:hypothetical protein PR202_ga28526 [Eleusine coracana subsp. coracana]